MTARIATAFALSLAFVGALAGGSRAQTPQPAKPAVAAPMPPAKPAIAEEKLPAKLLFSKKELPSLGHAMAIGWKGVLVGDMAQPRGGPLPFGHLSHQIGLDVDIWFMPMPNHELSKKEREDISASNLVAADKLRVNPETWTPADVAFI